MDWAGRALAALTLCTALTGGAQADPVADFYRGKTVTIYIGVGVGGEYDLQARLVARHIGRHIPGQPTVIAQNMTGAGGLKMTNFLATVAPRDGTAIGMIQNAFPALQAAGLPGIQFDANKFQWLGTIAPTVETMAVWHTAGVRSIDDARAREVTAGATARGSITHHFPALMNEMLGTKFKIITGYSGGNEINLAMERGEVAGRNNSWSSWKVTKRAWLDTGKIAVIAQAGPRAADLPAPSIEALARSPAERTMIELVVSGTRLGRPMTTTADVPADRLKALRAAFLSTMNDKDFVAEAHSLNFEIAPVPGERMQAIVAEILGTPPAIAREARKFLE